MKAFTYTCNVPHSLETMHTYRRMLHKSFSQRRGTARRRFVSVVNWCTTIREIALKKCMQLVDTTEGHSRSLKTALFDRLNATFCQWLYVVTSCIVSAYVTVCDLQKTSSFRGSGPLNSYHDLCHREISVATADARYWWCIISSDRFSRFDKISAFDGRPDRRTNTKP